MILLISWYLTDQYQQWLNIITSYLIINDQVHITRHWWLFTRHVHIITLLRPVILKVSLLLVITGIQDFHQFLYQQFHFGHYLQHESINMSAPKHTFIINWVLCYKMLISLCCNLMAQCLFDSFWSFTWFILYKNLAKCWSYLPQPGLKLYLLVLVNLNSVWLKIWIMSKNHLILG